jgi:hypothetical protein
MIEIDVYITISGGQATYKSTNPQVQEDGTITIDEGEDVDITFSPDSGTGQTWVFQSPFITIVPLGGSVTIVSTTQSEVRIEDSYPKDEPPSSYTYSLATSAGILDPRLINKGT